MTDRWWGERSEHPWEQEALEHIKALMPQRDPYRAWQCFSFTAASGQIRECDLFIVTPAGAFLVEIKSQPGRAINRGSTWTFYGDRVRTIDNPLYLTDKKAKELKSQLEWAAKKLGIRDYRSPYFTPAVFLSAPDLRCDFDEIQRQHVYGREGLDKQTGLPGIWSGLLNRRTHRSPDPVFFRSITRLMETIGAKAIRRDLTAGSYTLQRRAFDSGPTWTDYLGKHTVITNKHSRVRIYHYRPDADEQTKKSVLRAAEREYRSLVGVAHEGIVKAEDFVEVEGYRPAVVFEHRESWQRLDHFMQEKGADLDVYTRVEMVRQLAEAVNHAHRNRLFHRALAARSVWVELDGHYPRLRIADWQTAARQGIGSLGHTQHVGQTTVHALVEHIEAAAQAYLAPEVNAPNSDPRALDMFGLGALTFLILTGQPPGNDRREFNEHIREHGELSPAAVSDDIHPLMDTLVREATRLIPTERTSSPREFLRRLEEIEELLTRPEVVTSPLEATKGQEIIDGWKVESVLGKGATSRALLVSRNGEQRVFKVAVNDSAAAKLRREAEQLRRLRDRRIVAVIGDDPVMTIGEHTVLQLELAGEVTLADYLRQEGNLGIEELRRFGIDLFEIADYLEDQKVFHRDIKPANLGVRERTKKSRELVLFDFSLAGTSTRETQAGTPGYLDPFLAEGNRSYDSAAERYAIAVTLHEMASGDLPVWNEEGVEPHLLPDSVEYPRLSEEDFPDQVRASLTEFFRRALHRRPEQRFATLADMREAWEQAFQNIEASPVTTPDSLELAEVDDEATRRRNAENATADTPLVVAGLSPDALDAATRLLRCETVGDLLKKPVAEIRRLRGVPLRARNELARQANRWRRKLAHAEPLPKVSAKLSVDGASEEEKELALENASLDKIIRQFLPKTTERNRDWVRTVRELLGLPEGALAEPVWRTQKEVARRLGLQQATVSRHLAEARQYWVKNTPSQLRTAVRDDIVEILERHGRVREVRQIADELLSKRGTSAEIPETRKAYALAAIRVVTECEERKQKESPVFVLRRLYTHSDTPKVLVAQVIENDPTVPVEADLLDYAAALGREADRIVRFDDDAPLPSPAEVRQRLRGVPTKPGMAPLSDVDLVTLAAAASENAQATARLELYPRSLSLKRVLDIVQVASYLGEPGITPQQIVDRVRARFPHMDPPGVHVIRRQLREDFPNLESRTASDGTEYWYLPRTAITRSITYSAISAGGGYEPPSEHESARRRLDQAVARGGYLAVKTWMSEAERVAELLASRPDVAAFDASAEFVRVVTEMINQYGGPPWDVVVAADVPGGPPEFGNMVAEACMILGDRIRAAGQDRPVFVYGATPLARYPAGRDLLRTLAQQARESGTAPYGLWLLCPMGNPYRPARLDDEPAGAITDAEQLRLPRGFGAEEPVLVG